MKCNSLCLRFYWQTLQRMVAPLLWLNTSKSQHSTHRKGHLMINTVDSVRGFISRLPAARHRLNLARNNQFPYLCFSWWGEKKADLSVKSRSQLVCHAMAEKNKAWDTKIAALWLTAELATLFFLTKQFNLSHRRRGRLLHLLKKQVWFFCF